MAKRWPIQVWVKIPTTNKHLVNPIKADLEFVGWGGPKAEQQTLNFTNLRYDLEVEADGREVELQVHTRVFSGDVNRRVPDHEGTPGGDGRGSLGLGDKRGPVRESRARRSKARR